MVRIASLLALIILVVVMSSDWDFAVRKLACILPKEDTALADSNGTEISWGVSEHHS